MKRRKSIVIPVLLMLVCFFLCACISNSKQNKDPLVGKWEFKPKDRIIFYENGTYEKLSNDRVVEAGTYTATSDRITTVSGGETLEYEYEFVHYQYHNKTALHMQAIYENGNKGVGKYYHKY